MESKKTVTIQAVNPKSIPNPVYVTPAFDHNEGVFQIGEVKYKGIAIKDSKGETVAHETTESPLPLSTTKARPFKHGDMFDMDDPKDKMLVTMLIEQGLLCKEDERPNPQQHRFFMKDKMSDARRMIDRGTMASMALNAVNKMTADDHLNIAFIERQPVRQMNELEIRGFVFGLAQTNPQRVIDLAEDKNFKVRAFIQKLVGHSILSSGSSGYKYGETTLALDEEGAIHWMTQQENREMVQLFRAELEKRAPTSSPRKAAAAAAGEDGEDKKK
jgi:hypothetical protein